MLLCACAESRNEKFLSIGISDSEAVGQAFPKKKRSPHGSGRLSNCRGVTSAKTKRRHVAALNPRTETAEFSLRDSDGYYVTISALNPA